MHYSTGRARNRYFYVAAFGVAAAIILIVSSVVARWHALGLLALVGLYPLNYLITRLEINGPIIRIGNQLHYRFFDLSKLERIGHRQFIKYKHIEGSLVLADENGMELAIPVSDFADSNVWLDKIAGAAKQYSNLKPDHIDYVVNQIKATPELVNKVAAERAQNRETRKE